MNRPVSVAILLTCHNRRETTLACLGALYAQHVDEDIDLVVYLVDDGSSDGTARAVQAAWPAVKLLRGDGKLYWNGGMRLAFARALEGCHPYYLWLNDDTLLDPDAISRLLAVSSEQTGPDVIVVGATRDPGSDETSYSGVVRPRRLRPTRFATVVPSDAPQWVETMNGNCVLVPGSVADRIGNLDPSFTHAMGDFDYGLRARRAGCEVILAPGHFGLCARNPARPKLNDRGLRAIRATWAEMRDIKGLPPGDWLSFTRRWAGPVWPIYWLGPYVRQLGRALIGRR